MAQIFEDSIIVKASRLGRKDEADRTTVFDDETIATIEAVIQELIGNEHLVEVEVKNG